MSSIKLSQLHGRKPTKTQGTRIRFRIHDILDKEITLFSIGFTDRIKEAFYLELGTLLGSGLDIKSALELIEHEQEKPRHAEIIRNLKDELIGGNSLWEAMQKTGEFTPYEIYTVQIGEETGKLVVVLEQLAQFFDSRLKQRRQLIGALSYPVIILITSIGAVMFMLLFIVPMFRDVFKRFGGDLPGLTKVIIAFSVGIQANVLWFTLLVASASIWVYSNREKLWMRQFAVRLVKHIPVVGKIIYAGAMARFCTSMALLLSSKVPMLRALSLVHQMIKFYPIQVTLQPIEADILQGESLNAAMSRFAIFNRKMVSLIKVGEEVNKLDIFFDKLAKHFSAEAEHQTSLLNTFLEPAMIIFLGSIVGFILLAMYLPMFQMSTTIG